MKSKEEILIRAIILLALADRCALENKIVDGVSRSLKEREMQRQAIVTWLKRMRYYDKATDKEKKMFNSVITNKTNLEILPLQSNYECLEPMLWSLGLVNELSSYDNFVMYDLHPFLKFGKSHTFDLLLNSCRMISNTKIEDNRELSMLWYWRCIECRGDLTKLIDIKSAIHGIFGEKYTQLLTTCTQFDDVANDFMVLGRKVRELNNDEIEKLTIISERRFYAFEWMSTDAEWDSVDLVC